MTSISDLYKAQSDNWLNNGGNGEVDPAVMEDLGYTQWGDLQTVIDGSEHLETKIERISKAVGKAVCADCGKVFPCPHGTGSKTLGN